MQLTTPKYSELSPHISHSNGEIETGGICEIIYVVGFFTDQNEAPLQNHVSISDMLSIFDDDERGGEGLREARRWVGDTFYKKTQTLRTLRLAKGMSQAQLAESVGTQQSYIARIENGNNENIYLSTLQKLANALEVDMNLLSDALTSTNSDPLA